MICNEKVIKRSNGFFERTFNWDVIALSKRHLSNGYIVQHITRETNASPNFWEFHKEERKAFCHEYSEAWKVENGRIVYDEEMQLIQKEQSITYDDYWKYGATVPSWNGLMWDYVEKYLTYGKVAITGNVFWVDTSDSITPTLENTFKKNAIEYAGMLPSTNNFPEIENRQPAFSHNYISSWDFSTPEFFIQSICELYKIIENREQIEKDINHFFSQLPIVDELRKQLLP